MVTCRVHYSNSMIVGISSTAVANNIHELHTNEVVAEAYCIQYLSDCERHESLHCQLTTTDVPHL